MSISRRFECRQKSITVAVANELSSAEMLVLRQRKIAAITGTDNARSIFAMIKVGKT